ncbi:MAG: Methylcrotonyl-CoA carboxylase carboxyl transferase subunit, partial [uncultured Solirubrobacteraceae bacterium]
ERRAQQRRAPVVGGVRRQRGGAPRARRGPQQAARARPRRRRRARPRAPRGARQAAAARARRAAARRRGAVARALAAGGARALRRRRAGRGHDRRRRPRRRARVRHRGQRRHGQGRRVLPDDREEAPARAGDRAAQPPALHLPRRLGRRLPAPAGRDLSRPRALRPDLLQPGQSVGRRDRPDRGGHGLLHGRRRVRPGDERRDGHRPQPGHDLPRRAAAREGRDGGGGQRRGARRRRPAQPPLGRGRPSRRGRPRGAGDRALDRRHARAGGVVLRAAVGAPRRRGAGGRPVAALRRGARRVAQGLQPARDHRADRRRLALARVQGAVRQDDRVRRCAHPRPSGRDPRQPGRAVRRVGAQGRALRAVVRPARHPAAVLAERHGLHGRPRRRSRRDRPRRREDGGRGVVRAGAEADGDRRRLLRCRQLRHVRPRLRPALSVDVAQRADLGDGRRAGGDRARLGRRRRARSRAACGAARAHSRAVRGAGSPVLRDRALVGRRGDRPARDARRPRPGAVGVRERAAGGDQAARVQDV